jgi:hypothetical protein
MKESKLIKFLRWAGSSFIGHMVLYGLACGVSLSATGLALNYSEGTLTLRWGLWIVFVSTLGGVIVGILGWYFITLPLIKRRNGKY